MQETNKYKCIKCKTGELETYEKGSKLYNKLFICFKCDSVFENKNGKIIESELLTVI